MELSITGNIVTIKGNVKSIAHYNEIKSALDSLVGEDKIVIRLEDSISLTSSVIGYLSKLVNVDGKELELYVRNEKLYKLLDDLGLLQLFSVKRLKHDD